MISLYLRRSYLVKLVALRMFSATSSYEEAVLKLNSLQSNKSTLEQIRRDIRSGQEKCTNLEDMKRYLQRTGLSLEELDKLSVIHVAGTKGKGSTSAMCESILRQHGLRTGFYSSPHLVAVRERIRLDGRVISEQQFSEHFHRIYDLLISSRLHEGDMPKYFAFLTVLALHVFAAARVDVAVVEVGIGGVVDFTNVLRKVPVVGITSLGLDHTSILGSTLPQIAAAKAGIMKPGCEAYSAPQPEEAMEVLRAVAGTVQCSLTVVPEYDAYTFPKSVTMRSQPMELEAFKSNASLAIQLAHAWMRLRQKTLAPYIRVENGSTNGQNGQFGPLPRVVTAVPFKTADGIRLYKWPGRYQHIKTIYAQFCLDGAHTKESIEICVEWYKSYKKSNRCLIFSATGDRNAAMLLEPLSRIPFKSVYFVIPRVHKITNANNDNYSVVEEGELIARCRNHADIWNQLQPNTKEVLVLECAADAITEIKKKCLERVRPLVLITGSLHLVGAALSILDPNLSL